MSEIPRPPDPGERERLPPDGLIMNFEALNDREIMTLYRGLMALSDGTRETVEIRDPLLDRIAGDFARYAAYNPERGKNTIQWILSETHDKQRSRMADNKYPYKGKCHEDNDYLFVAMALPGLVRYDYEFTVSTLISLVTGHNGEFATSDMGDGVHGTAAARELSILMRDLPPEQAIDINDRLNAIPEYGVWDDPIYPAGPDGPVYPLPPEQSPRR
ncbi:hypothetical protein [Nocardia brasiliensis]|uniref:hypothetical protein n=1 Tax=Nocardia brasiliensis TaxID=37326 RepID=UPI003D8E93FF